MTPPRRFVIIDSHANDAEELGLHLRRTFIGCEVITFLRAAEAITAEDHGEMYFVDAATSAGSLDALHQLAEGNSIKLVLLEYGGISERRPQDMHFVGGLRKPYSQKEVRDLSRSALGLPEQVKLAKHYLYPAKDILYCTAHHHQRWKTLVITKRDTLEHGRHIGQVARLLTPYGFVKTDRAVLVNRALISKKEPMSGLVRITMSDGKVFVVARSHRDDLLAG